MKRYLYVLCTILAVCLFACSGDKREAQVTQPPPPVPAVKKAEEIQPVVLKEEKKRPEYTVSGSRDPFQPFEISSPSELARTREGDTITDPLQKLSLSQVEVVGIITGKQNRALVQETSGMGYIINEGTLIGENSGIVTKITLNGVTIKQHFKDYMGRVNTREIVLSLRKGEGDL
ncbi:MAG TPA: hypothetical protein ENN34_12765 [Deltaproteobacteria bacterium]|nr:hypothetical protein [Deltaproteobacteria bacterium]